MAALYSDFDISFSPDPVSKDLSKVEDVEAVEQSLKLLIMTNYYERVFQPAVGGDVRRMLFEPLDDATLTILTQTIADVIRLFERRATVRYIDVYTDKKPTGEFLDPNMLWIEIAFTVVNLPNLITTGVLLRRLR